MTTSRFCQSAIGSPHAAMSACVDVIAAEPRVAIGREHLEDALVEFENRNIERAAAEIEDGDFRAVAQLIETVGERCGGRFVDDALDGQAREFARAFCGVALRVIEIRGHGDDGARDFHAECALCVGAQFFQDERGDFLRRKLAVANADAHRLACRAGDRVARVVRFLADAAADETLHGIDRRARDRARACARRHARRAARHFAENAPPRA